MATTKIVPLGPAWRSIAGVAVIPISVGTCEQLSTGLEEVWFEAIIETFQ